MWMASVETGAGQKLKYLSEKQVKQKGLRMWFKG
jgi:hypothetical protein